MNTMSTKYREAIENARSWWRSRTPEERAAGFDVRKYRITPTVLVTVSKKEPSHLKVFIFSLSGVHTFDVKGSKRAISSLRRLYRCPSQKGWKMAENAVEVQFWRDSRIVNQEALSSAERFLWT